MVHGSTMIIRQNFNLYGFRTTFINKNPRIRVKLGHPCIFGTVISDDDVISEKKIQSKETYTNDATLRSGYFLPRNALGDSPAFWIFFSGFRDKG